MNVLDLFKFQIKNIHIILVAYITSLIVTGFIRVIIGLNFHDYAQLIPITCIALITLPLMHKYKRSVGDTKHEPYFILLSYIILGALYALTVQLIGRQYFF